MTLPSELRSFVQYSAYGPVNAGYREITGQPFYTIVTWWAESAKANKLAELSITRNAEQQPTEEVLRVFRADGSMRYTVTDAITYDGAFEVSRLRSLT